MSCTVAVLTNAVHNCLENIQLEPVQLQHGTGQLRGMLRIHVEGFPTAGAGQVQMGMTSRSANILIESLPTARFCRLADQPFRLQLRQIPVNGAETNLMRAQLLGDLPYG